jgi:glycosyltransferase involved in cell wall biosynthesis
MHIAIDVREACRLKRTGKGQWSYGFASELLRREIPLTFFTDRPLLTQWKPGRFGVKLLAPGLKWHLRALRELRRSHSGLYISPTSYLIPALLGRRIPCIPIIHDLIAFRKEPHEVRARFIERCTLGRVVRISPLLCTVSETTKHDLLERYPFLQPERIVPIYAGPQDEATEPHEHDGNTILCVGTLCPRKNQERLIRAYASLPSDLQTKFSLTLIGGRGWQDRGILKLLQKTPGVIWKGFVTDEEYRSLLHRCTIFALPSLYEGFGMPVLDALQRGIPVLLSDRGSLHEVAGSAAMYVDPEDISSIRSGLQKLLTDRGLSDALGKRGPEEAKRFSWARTVDLFLAALARVLP